MGGIYRPQRLLWLGLLAVALLLALPVARAVEPLPLPQSEVVLTVAGRINRGNAGPEAQFDRAMLERIGLTEVVTATPWHGKAAIRFEGVLLRDLLRLLDARGSSLLATAHNDYAAVLPIDDVERHDVILALRADGRMLTLREKGPLFIIYPYDSDRALRTDGVYARSVWQLRRLDVR